MVTKAQRASLAKQEKTELMGRDLAKQYEPGVYREGDLVTHYFGRFYKALKDTAEEPGKGEDWEQVGPFGFRWRGVKNQYANYVDGDLYIDNGTAFIWYQGKGRMFSKRGRDGKDGQNGIDGKDGKDAPQPIHMEWSGKTLLLAFDDGTVLDTDVSEVVEHYVKTIVAQDIKALSFFDQMMVEKPSEDAVPVGYFRGIYRVNESYQIGDLVNYQKGLYLATEKPEKGQFGGTAWRKIAGTGGGGGSGGSGVQLPPNKSILQSYNWVPGTSAIGGTWTDAREQQAVVDTRADLSDRVKLPFSHLAVGKLVYVKDEQLLYELIADTNNMMNDDTDWKPLVSGVTYVGRVGNLPLDAVHGQMFIIRMDVSGNDYYRIVYVGRAHPGCSQLGTTELTWHDILSGKPGYTGRGSR